MIVARTSVSGLRRAGLTLAAAVLGVGLAPMPARADGPGYGGDADALTVAWRSAGSGRGLVVSAVGFRSGSAVRVRVGSEAERSVTADPAGAVDMLLTSASTAVTAAAAAGTSVLLTGHTPAGDLRTLIGAVPPGAAGIGVADLVPWAGALALSGIAGLWLRRRFAPAAGGQLRRYRHPGRHRV
ncbi:hypothetical protein [Actinoplanes awajinensis]|uniref:Uncharacterized protein n=1 Tax=Actinoplanes awajinensis subsp. mycoplanecinus TaxID=135947 RepID=A0A101JIX5_9ACTN|nr:hypothetical protein [Actinoplanes awajinensis]KUL27698.1 hypothetical protein ADL15_34680 [Actinoplanes awajinensis subsp. mycoplanecinus]